MNYTVVIPAHNEEQFLLVALQSLAAQTHKPQIVMVVDDNSTDKTLEVANDFAAENSFVKTLSITSGTGHEPGSKVINAFNKGLALLPDDWDLIVKMDADVQLPEAYFERLADVFSSNPNTGIAGGLVHVFEGDGWKYEDIADKTHVRGPVKTYSRACFEAIGGLRNILGWDTLDELLARHRGYNVVVVEDLLIKHMRPTGAAYTMKSMVKHGAALYAMRYRPFLAFITVVKAALRYKSPIVFFSMIHGFLMAFLKRKPFAVSPLEGKFIRNHRWEIIRNKLLPRRAA